MKRRDFVKGSVAAAVSAGLLAHGVGASWATSAEMPYRRLGHTGEQVSLIGIGGAHLGKPKTDAEAEQIVRSAIDHGVNFIITAGITMAATAKSAWDGRCAMVTAKKSF